MDNDTALRIAEALERIAISLGRMENLEFVNKEIAKNLDNIDSRIFKISNNME